MKQNGKKRVRLLVSLLMLVLLTAGLTLTASAAVKISKKKVTLLKGQTVTLKVTGTKKTVKWSTSAKKVATVSKGKVTAKKAGTAKITAKVGSKKLTCTVTVEAPKLNKTKATVKYGKTVTLKLTGTKQKINWATSDSNVATVTSKGKVKAVAAGTATITATVLEKAFSCKITVTETPKISKTAASVLVGKAFTLKITGTSEVPLWKSSDESVASVTAKGEVTGKTVGTATISAVFQSKTLECEVTVKEDPSASTFDFARDCDVVPGKKEIYIEFKINKQEVSEDELKQLGYQVNDGVASARVTCETATYKFKKLPQTLDDIKKIPLTNKFGPVMASICACAAYDAAAGGMYDHPIFNMMDYLNGPNLEIGNVAKSGIYYSLKATLEYGKLAYFEGAKPGNAYVPSQPYTITLVHGPYYIPAKTSTIAHPNGEPERHMILISFEGDDSQRYVDVYSSKDGNWYTWDNSWQHLVASMKTPASSSDPGEW